MALRAYLNRFELSQPMPKSTIGHPDGFGAGSPKLQRWDLIGYGIGLAALVGGGALLLGSYTAGLLAQSYIFAILAVTTDVIWGYTGILTFASSAMFGVGAYAVGIVFVHAASSSLAVIAALAGGMAIAGVLSVIMGWLAFYSRIRVSEFYIAVVTLGLSLLFNQSVSYGGALTGGSNGLSGFSTLEMGNRAWYIVASLCLSLGLLGARYFVRSEFGLVLRAMRDHEQRCRFLGLHTPYLKTIVFTGGNAIAAIAGSLYALYTTVVDPSLVGIVLATNVLIWITLGGRGTIVGPAVAAVAINAATPELSTRIPLYWQGALGVLFVLVVVTSPRGLLPALWGPVMGLWPRNGGRTQRQRDSLISEPLAVPFILAPSHTAARAPDGSATPVLEVAGISKSYGSFHALSDVTMHIGRGELVSIVGPNGAGKTSLVRCISDGQERTSGIVCINGRSIGRSPPDLIVGLGLGRKFQSASVFETLTVDECLRVASWRGATPKLWADRRHQPLPAQALEVVATLGLHTVRDMPARDISHGQKQALELAMVLCLEPTLLVLDEPTAGLTSAERAAVGALLMRLTAGGRIAVLLIEHDFDFVKQISTRIVVLHEGRLLADGTVAEVANSQIVREVYVGRFEHRRAS
jgi:branched-chain amino acid transport system permease protein